MSTLRALDASAEAADACERAAVALKRATRDVEASARGFGLEPNAVARARQLCAEVIRLATRADAAIAAAHDAAALEASKTIHDAFLTPAEDRAATRERLESGSTEPVRVQLVRFRKSGRSEAPIAFLFHRRRASFAGSGSRGDSRPADEKDVLAREMMRSLLLEVRTKLDAPTAVSGLYRADGVKVVSPYAIRDGETLVAKMASDECFSDEHDASQRRTNTSRVANVVSRLTAVNARRDSARAAPAYAVNATPTSRPVSNSRPGGFVRPGSAPARSASSPLKARQSAKDAELARPKPVWVRSFAVKLRVRHAGSDASNITMRVPEKGLEGMSMALLRRRVALACGLEQGVAELTLRLSPGRTELRHPAELTPGCALTVLVDKKRSENSERKQNVRTGGAFGARRKTGASSEAPSSAVGGSTSLDFAPSSPAGKATRARVERLMEEEGAKSIADAEPLDATSPFLPSRKRSSRRNPYFVDPLAFADGRFDFSPAASSPRPPRKPDRFPMRKLTAKDLRRIRAPPASKSKPTPRPVVGEYSFGSRIRFDPAMLPPARRVAVAGDAAKKKKKKNSAVKKKTRAEAESSVARSESFPVEKPRDEREEEAVRVPVVAPAESGGEDEILGPNTRRSRRLPPKTPIRDPGLAAKTSDGEVAQASEVSPRTNYPYAEAEDARAFFDALAAEPAAETPRES
jgi:hypothetical protein